MNSCIKAISYYLPETMLSNADLCSIFPELKEEEILKSSGIKCRHISAPDQIASDIAFAAAEKLFEEHHINREEIDYLLYCTEALDYIAPATACILQYRLHLPKTCGTLDIPYGCTGFVYGLSVAKGLIESNQAKNVLLLTSDNPTKVIHPKDKELRIIFGDAGAATLLSATTGKNNIGQFVFGTDGSGYQHLIVRKTGFREVITREWIDENSDADGMRMGKMEMNSSEIFLFVLKVVPPMIRALLEKEHLMLQDIDLFVFHQANAQLLEIVRRKMKIPAEKFIIDMEKVGNTVSASIPIAFKNAMDKGLVKKGNKIMVCGFGIGLSWAGTIIEM